MRAGPAHLLQEAAAAEDASRRTPHCSCWPGRLTRWAEGTISVHTPLRVPHSRARSISGGEV